jgi:FMN phosphatase YigB (HAD superfamily)
VSEAIGYSKPDPKIFEAALSKMGHSEKKSVLMIGDSIKADIQGAQSAGIDTCWVNLKQDVYVGQTKPTYEVVKLEEILACF